jgi:hypothetical protein
MGVSLRPDSSLHSPSETERAVFGSVTSKEIHAFLNDYARQQLGSEIVHVRFRAGRIDAVWGVDLADGRAVVIKTHRPPADLEALRATADAQRLLVAASFPCPTPLSGPDDVDGNVVTAETLIVGSVPNGREAGNRRLLADGLARHIHLLRAQPELIERAGPGPSWCHYQSGPWPVPHDPLVDFSATTPGYEWLDQFGRRAADQILANRDDTAVVVGHADWYAGNVVMANGALVGTFDWELVADTEAVIAGFAAACYAASQTSAGGLSAPEEVADFMRDYESARAEPLSEAERRTAAAAAAWICAFTARWQVALLKHDLSDDYPHVIRVKHRQDDYLALSW